MILEKSAGRYCTGILMEDIKPEEKPGDVAKATFLLLELALENAMLLI